MTLSLIQHEEGCVPFNRCRACTVADIISGIGKKEILEIFRTNPDHPQFESGVHLSGCTPVNPCGNCEVVALLKKSLSEPKFKQILELMNDTKPLEVHQREREPSYQITKELLMKPVADLELSVRSDSCLKNDNIISVGDLCQKTEAEMLRAPNFGRKSLKEIKEILAPMGLHLGMEFPSDMLQTP